MHRPAIISLSATNQRQGDNNKEIERPEDNLIVPVSICFNFTDFHSKSTKGNRHQSVRPSPVNKKMREVRRRSTNIKTLLACLFISFPCPSLPLVCSCVLVGCVSVITVLSLCWLPFFYGSLNPGLGYNVTICIDNNNGNNLLCKAERRRRSRKDKSQRKRRRTVTVL